MKYEPDKKSLKEHEIPEWFHDAKLGIFIHWGLYSVPAYAPTEYGDIFDTFKRGPAFHYKHNPYAEWYLNSLRTGGGPYQKYHEETYGEDFSYDDFVPEFNEAIEEWNPDEMAELFKNAGARYVVLGTKHHDGFLLWPSKFPNPKKENYQAKRNIVGELTGAVRKKGLKMGFYYSGALDWSFDPTPIKDIVSQLTNGPADQEYADYVFNHYKELIDGYKPSLLFNDIGYPPKGKAEEIIAYYYNTCDDVVVNDRWTRWTSKWSKRVLKFWPVKKVVGWYAKKVFADILSSESGLQSKAHFDYRTPEYANFTDIKAFKWETCRGIGRSFGYNKMETDEHYIPVSDLVHLFIDVVSKNGNLLLNVGPMANGQIPELQVQRLKGLGKWLGINGEAIFGTRPWTRAEGKTDQDVEVRFTQKNDALYAIFLGKPGGKVTIKDLTINAGSVIQLLGSDEKLNWESTSEGDVRVSLPGAIEETPAVVVKIFPKPD